MTISIVNSPAPDHATVSSYTLDRLGSNPALHVNFQETLNAVVKVTVLSLQEISGSSVIQIAPNNNGNTISPGSQIFFETTKVGVVTNYSPTSEITSNTIITVPTGSILDIKIVNPFGIPAQVPCPGARSWSLTLNSINPEQMPQLSQMMGKVMFSVIKMAITELGLTESDQNILGAVQTINNRGDNIDSIISSVLEQLELDRRSRQITNINIMGDAP